MSEDVVAKKVHFCQEEGTFFWITELIYIDMANLSNERTEGGVHPVLVEHF